MDIDQNQEQRCEIMQVPYFYKNIALAGAIVFHFSDAVSVTSSSSTSTKLANCKAQKSYKKNARQNCYRPEALLQYAI